MSALSPLRLAAYSAPALVTSVAALPMALFVPAFYADELGVPLAAVGGAIAASRLLDVVTDPLIGRLSDRSRGPAGRRKPWMVLGVPLFLLSVWKVFVPGEQVTATYLAGWSALLYLGFTLIDLPHKAWGAELSTDYDERSRITGWREAIATAGQVLLLAVLVWLAAQGVDDAAGQLRGMATAIVVGLPILMLLCVTTVAEGPKPSANKASDGGLGFLPGLKSVARNPAFLRMVGCVLFFVSGVAIQGTLHRLVLADVMHDEGRFPVMILIENALTLLAVPAWLALSLRIGKHRALMAAAGWLAIWSLPLVFLRQGSTELMMTVVVIRGSSFASILFLANSMAADVIDVDTLLTGEQRSGLFFAVWGMTIKVSLALGVLLGSVLPAVLGYDPSGDVVGAAVQSRLMFVYGGIPAALMGVGALFLWGFPLTRERHAEVQARLRMSAQ
ncbi:MAG: MFS transporter [Deltaproteobacteria bacterium]|nr:MFS transporter [Deltaproteobacteria bacterium]